MSLLRFTPEAWQSHLDTRYVAGQKQTRQMRVAEMSDLNDGDSVLDTAQRLGVDNPTLWGYAIHGHVVADPEQTEEWALVATAPFSSAWGAYAFWRNRWRIENSGFRELKAGWLLEKSLWTFRNPVVVAARVAFTLMAFNVAQIAKSNAGTRLAQKGIRRLRRRLDQRFGSVPIIVFAQDAFTILHIEELVELLGGKPPRFSFRRSPPEGLPSLS